MKRWMPIALLVMVLMVGSLLAGMVLAQGGAPSSGEGGQVPTGGTAVPEADPAGSAVAAPAVSSADGAPVAAPAGVPEIPPEAGTSAAGGAGSSSDGGVPAGVGLWPEETAPEGYQSPANAPEYNTSVRFVGSSFKPRENDVDYEVQNFGGCVYVTAGISGTVWNLPLALPEGARVDFVRIYMNDTNVNADSCGWFTKYDLYGELIDEWAVCSSGDAGNGYWTTTISPTETIDYGSYSYVLNWRPGVTGDTIQLCGMRLFYTAPYRAVNFLPNVDR